jgi:hypothetical protein
MATRSGHTMQTFFDTLDDIPIIIKCAAIPNSKT